MSTANYTPGAVATLSDNEKNRLICVLVNLQWTPAQVDYKKAAAEFGSASVESMTKMVNTTLKKFKQAAADGVAAPTSIASPTKGGGRKRKAAAEDGGDGGETPKAKKGRGKNKAAAEETDMLMLLLTLTL